MIKERQKDRAPVRIGLSVHIELDEDGHVQVELGRNGDVAADPLGYVKAVRAGVRSLEETVEPAVHAARRQRMTWDEIGAALGVTRQSAWERYAVE
jgi:hypothetical protein